MEIRKKIVYPDIDLEQVTNAEIINMAKDDNIFDELLMNAVCLYPRIDRKCFNVWIMFMLLDTKKQQEIMGKIKKGDWD